MASFVRMIFEHLTKSQASAGVDPRGGWRDSVLRVRDEIEDVLNGSPSLRPALGAVVSERTGRAPRLVALSMSVPGEARESVRPFV